MTLHERLQEYVSDENNKYYGYEMCSDEAKEIIEALRFQQELVRCGKCANALPWNGDTSYCSVYSYDGSKVLVIDEGYCHMGERRDTE